MNTSTNVHNTKEIKVREDHSGNTKWITITFQGEFGSHAISAFGLDLYDVINACEKAVLAQESLVGVHEEAK
jgi:hypothetical protein